MVTAADVRARVPAGVDAAEWTAEALNANEQMAGMVAELREENAQLREGHGAQQAELERVAAELAVLQTGSVLIPTARAVSHRRAAGQ